jgi:hypothetical protein
MEAGGYRCAMARDVILYSLVSQCQLGAMTPAADSIVKCQEQMAKTYKI